MLIIDGDYPMSYGAIEKQRDLTLPIDLVRARTRGGTPATNGTTKE